MRRFTLTYILFLSFCGAMLPVQVHAQVAKLPSRAAIDSIVNPSVMAGADTLLRFDTYEQRLAKMTEDDAPRACAFVFTNVSHRAVRITRVKTSCGCTAAVADTALVAPGGTGTITLTFHPNNRPGDIDVRAFVYASWSDKHPVARLSLSGEVAESSAWKHYPYSVGSLKLKRRQVSFPEVKEDLCPSERILCLNGGKRAMKLSAKGLPAYASFHTEPETIEPGQEADIVITIDGKKAVAQGKKNARFFLLIEGTGSNRPATDSLIEVQCNFKVDKTTK